MRRDSKNKLLFAAAATLATAMGCGSLASAEHPGLAATPQPATTDPSHLAIALDRAWLERDGTIEVSIENVGPTPWVLPWFEPGAACLEESMRVRAVGGDVAREPAPCDPRLAGATELYLAPGDRVTIGRIEGRDLGAAPAGDYVVELPVAGAMLSAELGVAAPRMDRDVNVFNGGMHLLQLGVELSKAGKS